MAALPTDELAGAPAPAPTDHADRPHLRVVDEPRRTGRWLALLGMLAVAALVGIVSLSALSAEASYTASELEAEITELSYRYDELTAEVATLESPARIRQVAEQELGMVPSEQPAYLVLDGQVGESSTAADVASEPPDVADSVQVGRARQPAPTGDDGHEAELEYTSHTAPAGGGAGD